MVRFGWGPVVACFALIAGAAKPAHAQTDHDRAAARSTADAGADAFGQGRYAEALDLFSRAEQLFHAPPHLLFMARSQEKLGRLVDAHETYLKISNETLSARAPAAFRKAQTEAEKEMVAVAARIAHVTITIQGLHLSAPALFIDGAELSSAIVGIPFPIDPGVHVFQARVADAQSSEVSQSFADGVEASVTLTLTEPKPASASRRAGTPAASREAAQSDPGHSVGTAQRAWGIVALAAGAGGIGLGVYFTASSRSSHNSGKALYNACDSNDACSADQEQAIRRDYSAADRSGNLSIVSYVAGGLGVATGLVLLLTGSTKDSPSSVEAGFNRIRIEGGNHWLGVSGSF